METLTAPNKGARQPEASKGTDLHPAYVAGFIDADGCISIGLNSQDYGSGKGARVSVIVVQKSRISIGRLHQRYGGYFAPYTRNGSTYHRWCAIGKLALEVLEEVRPYLLNKAEQADIAIEFVKRQQAYMTIRKGHRGYEPISEDERDYRLAAKEKMHMLNSRKRPCAAATTKPSGRRKADAIV